MADFQMGQLVRHRDFDYRGVVIKVDPECLASDEWYGKYADRPARGQPWYHVLVDGGQETYVGEELLEPDYEKSAVTHPLVEHLFLMFVNGRYYRFCPN